MRQGTRRGDGTTSAKLARRLASCAAELERKEDAKGKALVRQRAEARILEILDDAGTSNGRSRAIDKVLSERTPHNQRALLIINAKSGRDAGSLLHVREIVEALASHGIGVDVRVKLKKSVARREARQAAKVGYPLVIAAGGDGTVASVASGVVGTAAALGIVPLGTYNNTATSLGIPRDVQAACALIAQGVVRHIDVGEVRATGKRRRVLFLEVGAVGLAATLTSVGQHMEKGRWEKARSTLPHALGMEPTLAKLWLDRESQPREARTLLMVVGNGPRAGAGLELSPTAKLDDGLLHVHVYEDLDQVTLAARFAVAQASGVPIAQESVHSHVRKVRVKTVSPLPVVADSKVIGMTPASFRIRSGALKVMAGNGPGLARPASDSFIAAVSASQPALPSPDREPAAVQGDISTSVRTLSDVVPAALQALERAEKARAKALPIALALAGGVMLGSLLRRAMR